MTENLPEKSDTIPARSRLQRIGESTIRIGIGMAAGIGLTILAHDSGPRNGITKIRNIDCTIDAENSTGVTNIGNEKVVRLVVLPPGVIRVTLRSREVSEGEVRDAGLIPDPWVTFNELTLECPPPLASPPQTGPGETPAPAGPPTTRLISANH